MYIVTSMYVFVNILMNTSVYREKDKNDADVEIGQKIVDECVKPKLNNTFDE